MRTKALLLVAVALAGCSLAYNGSRFQGGTGTDAGTPVEDAGVDGSTPIVDAGVDAFAPADDTGVDAGAPDTGPVGCHAAGDCTAMGTYCDATTMTCVAGCDANSDCALVESCNVATHVCGPISCTTDAPCPMDTFCDSGACVPCDADGDHYYSMHATATRCARAGHAEGDDCQDDTATIHPFARADCTTAQVESCPLPIMVEPMGATVLENGITDEHVLWASTSGSIRVGGRRIGMVLGDDTPQLPSGVGNGFVGFIGNTGMRGYFGVPFALEGAPGTPEPLFTTYDIADGVLGRTEGDGNNWIAIGVAGTFGGSSSFSYTQAAFQRPAATVAPLTTASFTAPGQLFGGGRPSIAIADWVGHPGAAGLFDPGGSSAPTAVNLSPTVGHMTGGANALSGTWMTGSGAAVMWMASPTSVAVWNGADTGISPPTIDLSSFTSTVGNPVLLNVDFPGSISHTTSSDGLGTEYFVAAVPIASTATPPVGRIAILRWSYARPTSSSQRTDATIPSSVAITELMIGPQFQPSAGVAVYVLDTSATFVSYVERGNVVLRQITTGRPSGGGLENPPTVDMLHLGSGESAQSMVLDAGLYARDPRFPSGAVGRLALTAMFQVTGSSWELRTRSFEACIQP